MRSFGIEPEMKAEIKKRLSEFKAKWKEGGEAVFAELAFCLCTPQSNALKCGEAVRMLVEKKCFSNSAETKKCLHRRVRFHNNKSAYIAEAREFFERKGKLEIKKILKGQGIEKNHLKTREWLVQNVKGLGLKEASHFLRNIGFYENLAILDRHILKNLKALGAIKEVPKHLGKKEYLEIEKKLLAFCKKNKVRPEELDLALWAKETGFVFR
ncbi:MAG: N-glycosylase/DNA lyase [Candidatus Diapherotrites archaeon]